MLEGPRTLGKLRGERTRDADTRDKKKKSRQVSSNEPSRGEGASRIGAFFFSSRRRHTRCSRDWSSDVCYSDLDRLCRGLLLGELEAPDEVEMSSQLSGGPERDPQAANELLRGAQSISLRHVCGDRDRGASDLIHESEMPVERGCHREPIRSLGELLRHTPSVQLLELSHRAKIEPRHASLGTSVLRTGYVFAQHVSRFPFPLSRV